MSMFLIRRSIKLTKIGDLNYEHLNDIVSSGRKLRGKDWKRLDASRIGLNSMVKFDFLCPDRLVLPSWMIS